MIGWGVGVGGGGWGVGSSLSPPTVRRQESRQILVLSTQDILNKSLSVNDDLILCVLRSAGKRDIGSYSCVLENQLGAGKSARSAYLDVHYPPQVLYPEV